MTRLGAGALCVIAALGASGCVEKNAYLELTLSFPPDARATGSVAPRNAFVRVNTTDVPFDSDWESSEALPTVALDPKQTTKLSVSIEGRVEIETTPVRIKVRFCRDPNCVGIDDDSAPEVRYEIERAFYIGNRTSLALSMDCIPNVTMQTDPPPVCDLKQDSVIEVPKCSVAGCRDGVTSDYCANGKHFCEQ